MIIFCGCSPPYCHYLLKWSRNNSVRASYSALLHYMFLFYTKDAPTWGQQRNAPRGDQALPCPQLRHRHESPDTGEQEEVVIHLHAPLRIDRHPGHSRWPLDGAPLELAWINECEILHFSLIPLTSLVKLSWYSGVESKGVIVTNSSFYARSIAHGQGKFFLLPVWCKQHTSWYEIPR